MRSILPATAHCARAPSLASADAAAAPSSSLASSSYAMVGGGNSRAGVGPANGTALVCASFQRLLAMPHYGLCPLRRATIDRAISAFAPPSSSSSSLSSMMAVSSAARASAASAAGAAKMAAPPAPAPPAPAPPAPAPSRPPPAVTAADLVLDAHRPAGQRLFPGVGHGLRRIALEALDPTLPSYACTTPGGGAICYDEVAEHVARIRALAHAVSGGWVVAAVGSHRRGALGSRSIDVLVSDPSTRAATTGADEAPFAVLGKIGRAMVAAGYAVHVVQQPLQVARGGVATMAALGRLEAPPLRVAVPVDGTASVDGVGGVDGDPQDQQAPSVATFLRKYGPPTRVTLSAAQAAMAAATERARTTRDSALSAAPIDIAAGALPSHVVTPKAQSMMSAILKMHDRQRARVAVSATGILRPAAATAAPTSAAAAATPPAMTSADVLRDIMSPEVEDDDGAADDSVSYAAATTQSRSQHADATPAALGGGDNDGDDDDDDELAFAADGEIDAIAEASGPSKATTTTVTAGGGGAIATPAHHQHEQVDAASASDPRQRQLHDDEAAALLASLEALRVAQQRRSRGHGLLTACCFPLDTRTIPRRVNLVWAPWDRFFALKLLLTGPRDFADFVIDRAPRFGYRLTEDGLFERLPSRVADDGRRRAAEAKRLGTPTTLPGREQRLTAAIVDGAGAVTTTSRLRRRDGPILPPRPSAASQVPVPASASSSSRAAPELLNSEAELLRKLGLGYIAPFDR